jgi:hypothetical protein
VAEDDAEDRAHRPEEEREGEGAHGEAGEAGARRRRGRVQVRIVERRRLAGAVVGVR